MKKQTVLCTIWLAAFSVLSATSTMAGVVEVLHADSLAGPMKALKKGIRGEEQGRYDQSDAGCLQATRRTHHQG